MAIDDPLDDRDQRYEFVDLSDQGEWFVSHRRVTGEEMRSAIDESIEAKDLDAAWREWSEDAWVSVAVRRDGTPIEARMYTYLPMEGQAEAPPSRPPPRPVRDQARSNSGQSVSGPECAAVRPCRASGHRRGHDFFQGRGGAPPDGIGRSPRVG